MLKAYDAWIHGSFEYDAGTTNYSIFERDCKADLETMAMVFTRTTFILRQF